MCASDRAVQLDIDEAYMCGRAAVELAAEGRGGLMVALERQSVDGYNCTAGVVSLSEVAVRAKPLPDEYINDEGNFINEDFLRYLRPLVGRLPEYVKL